MPVFCVEKVLSGSNPLSGLSERPEMFGCVSVNTQLGVVLRDAFWCTLDHQTKSVYLEERLSRTVIII